MGRAGVGNWVVQRCVFPPTQMIRLLWLSQTEPRLDLPMGQLLWSILLAWKTLHLHQGP